MKRSFAVIPGIAALLAGACALPFSPDSSSVAGTWTGRYEQLTCTIPGPDPRGCAHHRVGTVTLVLTDGAAGISGTALFRADQGDAVIVGTLLTNEPIQVSGTFDGTRLSIAGSDVTPTPVGVQENSLHDWVTTLDQDDELNGTAAWTGKTTANGTVTSSERVYRLTALRRR